MLLCTFMSFAQRLFAFLFCFCFVQKSDITTLHTYLTTYKCDFNWMEGRTKDYIYIMRKEPSTRVSAKERTTNEQNRSKQQRHD